MKFSRYRNAKELVDVDLTPVMNLFVTLIPFLLLAAAFYHVGVVPASLPSQTDDSSDIASTKIAVTVNLIVAPEGIRLSATSSGLDEETLNALAAFIEKKDGKYDLELLSKALHAIKTKYSQSDTVVVLPGEHIEYQDVVQILDSAREFELEKNGVVEKIPLFPVVVLSRKV